MNLILPAVIMYVYHLYYCHTGSSGPTYIASLSVSTQIFTDRGMYIAHCTGLSAQTPPHSQHHFIIVLFASSHSHNLCAATVTSKTMKGMKRPCSFDN